MLQVSDEPIPGYRLEKFLGKGQYGEVWKASAPGQTHVALKFLDLGGKQGWKELRAIQRVKQIRHPHLLPITALWLLDAEGKVLHDADLSAYETDASARETLAPDAPELARQPQQLVVATILADKSLADRLDECKQQGMPAVPLAELLAYMDEAAKGIDYLNRVAGSLGGHGTGVQHCDIKPANIMIVGNSVMIGDFGLAQLMADAKSAATATSMIGSPAYMAPECIGRKPSAASDQYSLAITYVELRTGELPFTSQGYLEVLDAHRTGKLDLARLTPAEQKVIRQATATKPGDRFPSVSAMVAALRQAVAPASKPDTRERGALVRWAIAATLLIVLAAAVWVSWPYIRDKLWPVPLPIPDKTVVLQLTPPDAYLVIDGTDVVVENGRARITRKATQSINVSASRDGYQPISETLSIARLSSPHRIELKPIERERPDPEARVAEAERLFREGKWDEAAARFADVIENDAIGTYSSVPRPTPFDVLREGSMTRFLAANSNPLLAAATSDDRRGLLSDEFTQVQIWLLGDPWSPQDGLGTPAGSLDRGVVLSALAAAPTYVAVGDKEGSLHFFDTAKIVWQDIVVAEKQKIKAVLPAWSESDIVVVSLEVDMSSGVPVYKNHIHWVQVGSEPRIVELGTHEDLELKVARDADPAVKRVYSAGSGIVRAWEVARPLQDRVLYDVSNETPIPTINALVALPGTLAVAGELESDNGYEVRWIPLSEPSEGAGRRIGHLAETCGDTIEVLAKSDSGRWLAAGDARGQVNVWDVSQLSPAGDFEPTAIVAEMAHDNALVSHLVFRGDVLVSAAQDRTLVLFELDESSHPMTIAHLDEPIAGVVIDPDCRWLIVATTKGRLHVWSLDRLRMLKRAWERLQKPATPQPYKPGAETVAGIRAITPLAVSFARAT